jgi:hypothetical protein
MDNPEIVVRSYLEAFGARDMQRCLEFFADEATVSFHVSTFKGRQQIEQWHKDRFEADLRLLHLENVSIDGGSVTIEGVITSKRLRAWLINEMSGALTVRVENGKIQSAKFNASL